MQKLLRERQEFHVVDKVQDKLAALAKLRNKSYRLDEKRVFRVMYSIMYSTVQYV